MGRGPCAAASARQVVPGPHRPCVGHTPLPKGQARPSQGPRGPGAPQGEGKAGQGLPWGLVKWRLGDTGGQGPGNDGSGAAPRSGASPAPRGGRLVFRMKARGAPCGPPPIGTCFVQPGECPKPRPGAAPRQEGSGLWVAFRGPRSPGNLMGSFLCSSPRPLLAGALPRPHAKASSPPARGTCLLASTRV